MKLLSVSLVWLLLMALLGVEIFAATLPQGRAVPPFVGMVMALVVAFTFMRLGASRGLTPVFALAGVFWVCVLMGMGSLDAFTRRDVPAAQMTYTGYPAPH